MSKIVIKSTLQGTPKSCAEGARKAGYLCGECAENLGGRWPRGHRATFHGNICPVCLEVKMLASWDDWNWPRAKEIDRAAKALRKA